MISAARWQKIQSLFEQMIETHSSERAGLLASACGKDIELRQSVESLLASDQAPDFLQKVIGNAAESLLEEHQDRLLGTRVGPYRIESILGHGGMSTVYRAERDDLQYRQSVAIKVLHHSTLHPRMRSRLHSERHILAKLDHPSIARLIDSGDLEDGTPYLVMELIDGQYIDTYCDKRTLFVPERIAIFNKVCAVVQFAHRNLVVHRDIKSANIFITEDGAPKLLDFGIAKLLAPESLSHTLPVTRLQERVLTPENAAPEQILGRPITTATDIYALGVLLYQLLTGRSPYRILSYSQLQLERAICMDDPVKPSQAVVAKLAGEKDIDRSRISDRRGLSPERLHARLAGDLDAIIAKAMRKEPDRRYATVDALTEDLNRHLLGQPVLARQGDWRYNTAKFLRRHVVGVVGVFAIFSGLVAIAGITLWQSRRIEQARVITAQERDRAQQVSGFLVDVFSQADPFNAQGHESTARDLLDQGAEKILGNQNLQPEVRAELLESIGLAYQRQGLSEKSIPLFEQALAIRRQVNLPDERRIATALANLAGALSDAGHLTSAEAYLDQALTASRPFLGARAVVTADILAQFGLFLIEARSQPERASKYFVEALAIYRDTLGNQHISVAKTLTSLATAQLWLNNYSRAEQYQREAMEIFQATVSRSHPEYALALANLGNILTLRGKYSESERVFLEALQIQRSVFGATSSRVADTEARLGTLYDHIGDLPRAIAATENAIKITNERLGSTHYLTGYYQSSLASLYLKSNNIPAAETNARQALVVYAKALPARHLYVASTRQLLGEVLLRRGAFAAAESELHIALEISNALDGADSWRSARASASLGWVLMARGNSAEGEPMMMAARAKLLSTVGAQHEATLLASARLAQYFKSHHRDAEAARILAPPATTIAPAAAAKR
jgi:serine/threonine protein kinase